MLMLSLNRRLATSKQSLILVGGCLLFEEAMPPTKLAGLALSMSGIVW